ncbi:hypothetical protein [Spirosoma lituiforme]
MVKEQITQMVLNGADIRDTAASAVRSCFRRQSQYRQRSV